MSSYKRITEKEIKARAADQLMGWLDNGGMFEAWSRHSEIFEDTPRNKKIIELVQEELKTMIDRIYDRVGYHSEAVDNYPDLTDPELLASIPEKFRTR